MARFTERPQKGTSAVTATVKRVKAQEKVIVVCISDRMIGTDLHYVGRSVPCMRDHDEPSSICPYCEDGNGTKWEGYVLTWAPATNIIEIYGVSEANAATIDTYYDREGTLRGALLTMSRGTRANEKVRIAITKSNYASATLPKSEDLRHTLNVMWYGKRVRQVAQRTTPYDEHDYTAQVAATPASDLPKSGPVTDSREPFAVVHHDDLPPVMTGQSQADYVRRCVEIGYQTADAKAKWKRSQGLAGAA